jgi:hypothetical protein
MKTIRNKVWAQIFIIYTRYLLGATFVFASLIKIKGRRFTGDSGESHPIDTAWHFFETMYQSGLYWKFIGLSQLLAGFLLMTQKYSRLGALLYLPVILNIFVITLSYYFAFTPVITGLLLLANVLLLAWDWDTFKVLLNLEPVVEKHPRLENDRVWAYTGLLLFLFTFFYRLFINRYDIFLWGGICLLIGLAGLFAGLWKKRKSGRDNPSGRIV